MIPRARDHQAQLEAWFAKAAAEAKKGCEDCGGKGYVVKLDAVFMQPSSSRCECMKRANHEFAMRRGNVPSEYRKLGGMSVLAPVADFIAKLDDAEARRGLLLVGSYGSGKTTAACQVLSQAAGLGRSIFRVEATEVERALSLIKSRQDWVDQWLQDGMYSDVVAVDELGAEAVAGTNGREARSLISYFVKHRVENGMPTVVCTNLEQDDFVHHYGEATASVVFGHRYTVATVGEQDFRR